MVKEKKQVSVSVSDVYIDPDDYVEDVSDDALSDEYQSRFGLSADIASDLRKAFADQDKMHFDVLIDRMLADAGCA